MLRVPLASSGLRDIDIEAAISILRSGNLTMGEQVREFEIEIADYLGVKNFVMMNSGSSANLAIFEALLRPAYGQGRLRKGDSVLVPAIAWPTTIWPILQLGLDPVFVDIDPHSISLDLNEAEKVIKNSQGKNFSAIFPIHPLGLCLKEESFMSFAKEHGLIYISDACEALGAFWNGSAAGAKSFASSYSFYFSHHLTTMEGGGVATNDDGFTDDLRSIRSHGWSRDRSDSNFWKAEKSLTESKFLFVTTGFNVRPMEIQAAIGRSQLPDLELFLSKRRIVAQRVSEAIEGTGLKLIDDGYFNSNDKKSHSWMLIAIKVDEKKTGRTKIEITQNLEAKGIETRPVLTGNFLAQPSIRRIFGHLPHPEVFKSANEIAKNAFLVGAHHDLNGAQIDHLVASLKELA
jgi:CDP-4-dehydro-6-deoxyglucose reductase, E1